MTTNIIASVFLLIMFTMSGIHKISTFTKSVENLQEKLTIPYSLAQLGIVLVILLEIVAPIIIVYYLYTKQYQTYANWSIWALIVFTIVATIVYHPLYISNYYKSIPFWANVSLIGGLLLLKNNV
jgi:uncharacterized membrane protein YphA (DoxX/SURF4 family)